MFRGNKKPWGLRINIALSHLMPGTETIFFLWLLLINPRLFPKYTFLPRGEPGVSPGLPVSRCFVIWKMWGCKYCYLTGRSSLGDFIFSPLLSPHRGRQHNVRQVPGSPALKGLQQLSQYINAWALQSRFLPLRVYCPCNLPDSIRQKALRRLRALITHRFH